MMKEFASGVGLYVKLTVACQLQGSIVICREAKGQKKFKNNLNFVGFEGTWLKTRSKT